MRRVYDGDGGEGAVLAERLQVLWQDSGDKCSKPMTFIKRKDTTL